MDIFSRSWAALRTAVAELPDEDFAFPALRGAVQGLADRPGEVDAATSEARKAAGQVRRHYQPAMAELLRQEVGTGTLTRRELLLRLDVVGLRLGESVAALSDAMLKRSH